MQTFDFDKPIDALIACHRVMLEQMATVERLAHELLVGGAATFESQAAEWQGIAEFFRTELNAHTRDEEEGLFPLLAGLADDRVERFTFDHRWIRQNEQIFLSRYESLASNGCDGIRAREFALEALEIASHYRRHIAVEEEDLFPVAGKLLTSDALAALSSAMREHRAAEPA